MIFVVIMDEKLKSKRDAKKPFTDRFVRTGKFPSAYGTGRLTPAVLVCCTGIVVVLSVIEPQAPGDQINSSVFLNRWMCSL
jgi:hypothetical protein